MFKKSYIKLFISLSFILVLLTGCTSTVNSSDSGSNNQSSGTMKSYGTDDTFEINKPKDIIIIDTDWSISGGYQYSKLVYEYNDERYYITLNGSDYFSVINKIMPNDKVRLTLKEKSDIPLVSMKFAVEILEESK